jgi:hypothetical protein
MADEAAACVSVSYNKLKLRTRLYQVDIPNSTGVVGFLFRAHSILLSSVTICGESRHSHSGSSKRSAFFETDSHRSPVISFDDRNLDPLPEHTVVHICARGIVENYANASVRAGAEVATNLLNLARIVVQATNSDTAFTESF